LLRTGRWLAFSGFKLRCAFDRILYCDESGDSGSNYVDAAQPVHVHAGWLVPASTARDFREACDRLREAAAQREAKGGTLGKHPRRRAAAVEFIGRALRAGASPVFIIVEKRFCIVAKMVEAFADPFYNAAADWIPTGADDLRKTICEKLLRILPHQTLQVFSDAQRDPTVASFKSVVESIAFACRFAGSDQLEATFKGCIPHLADVVEAERNVVVGSRRHATTAVNLFAFVAFMAQADELIEQGLRAPVRVLHDESYEFEDAFRAVHELFQSSSALYGPYLLQSGRAPRLGVQYLRELRMAPSNAVPELQGTDMLAAVLREVARDAALGAQNDRYQPACGLMGAAFPRRARFDVIGSAAFIDTFTRAFAA
jgi:hypothetical protein